MSPVADWIGPAVTAALVAWVSVLLVRRHAPRLGLLDRPNHRSSHKQPTPRGGGIGIVLGAGAGLLTATGLGGAVSREAWTVFMAATAVSVVGLIDDVRGLPARIRFVVHAAAAIAVVATVGPFETFPLPSPMNVSLSPAAGWFLALLWITAVTNFFNFMDGIDGLAGGQAVASLVAIAVAGWFADASLIAVCAAAASLGFLLHNWAPARIFMGDTGSGFLGFLIAALPLLAPSARGGEAIIAVAIGMALFLADPFETLIRRLRAGRVFAGAHREHAYQQFLDPGEPAGVVSTLLVATGLLLALLGVLAFRQPRLGWVCLAIGLLAYLVERGLAARRSRMKRQP